MSGCGCGAAWTGLGMAHCTVCHETFSTVSNFDRHRQPIAKGGERACRPPADAGLVVSVRPTGTRVWAMPGRPDEDEAA
jgi:hypothetical protein